MELDVYQLRKCINLPAVATDRDSSRVCINMYSHYIIILHNMLYIHTHTGHFIKYTLLALQNCLDHIYMD